MYNLLVLLLCVSGQILKYTLEMLSLTHESLNSPSNTRINPHLIINEGAYVLDALNNFPC